MKVFFTISLAVIVNVCAVSASCIIKLKAGRIRGNCSNPAYDSYQNIPYAQPPVGNLRFEAPRPALELDGILDATGGVVVCRQFYATPRVVGVEDCLFVHVYAPKPNKNSCSADYRVIINIHGGGFQHLTASVDPKPMMEDGETIVVSIAYRLGALGFLSARDCHLPGNLGLKDQQLAIKWVHDNIAAFGGNKNKIILMGLSAGAASVEAQLIAGRSKVNAYVAISGSILSPWTFTKKPLHFTRRFAAIVNCPFTRHNDAFKNCLKSKSVDDIWEAAMQLKTFYYFKATTFRPTIEPCYCSNTFFTEEPIELLKQKRLSHDIKPYLVGTIKGIGTFPAVSLLQIENNNIVPIEELNQRWDKVCPTLFYFDENNTPKQQQRLCSTLRQRYMCNREFSLDTYKLVERMFGDQYYYNGIEQSVKLHQAAGQKLYRYYTDLPIRYNPIANALARNRTDICLGSALGNDFVGILLNNLLSTPNTFTPTEIQTYSALNRLIKSMLSREGPKYKHLRLPVNSNNQRSDRCLRFKFGKEHIDNCRVDGINCDSIESVQCDSESK